MTSPGRTGNRYGHAESDNGLSPAALYDLAIGEV
jgi:hypothetical protein